MVWAGVVSGIDLPHSLFLEVSEVVTRVHSHEFEGRVSPLSQVRGSKYSSIIPEKRPSIREREDQTQILKILLKSQQIR